MLLRARFLPVATLCVAALICVGCGEPAQTGSATEKLNTAPPLEPETPQAAAGETAEPAEEEAATPKTDAADSNETTSTANVDLKGMTFAAPADWNREANPFFVEAKFILPGEDGDAELTIMPAGGGKQANIDRWIGQFKMADGDEPAMSEIDVDSKTATMVDIRGTFNSGRPGKGPAENYRMLAFIIPFSASDDYFVKATGPQGTIAAHEDAIVKFAKTGKLK